MFDEVDYIVAAAAEAFVCELTTTASGDANDFGKKTQEKLARIVATTRNYSRYTCTNYTRTAGAMSGFSGAVKIGGDLNDFIAPSQACVVSLNGNKLDTRIEDEVRTCTHQRIPEFLSVIAALTHLIAF